MSNRNSLSSRSVRRLPAQDRFGAATRRARAAAVFVGAALSLGPLGAFAGDIEAFTKPSADVTLSFVRGGRVAEVLVKEGDLVKSGQLLARQEDEAETIQLQQLDAQAADTTKVEMAESELAQKVADLKKYEQAQLKGAATEWETEHNRLNVRMGELAVKQARFERELNRLRRDELKSQIDRLHVLSPIDGRVEEVVIERGESAQPLAPVLRVVGIDPLWVDVPVPVSLARQVKSRNRAHIEFPASSARKRVEGRIINVSSVADAASDTLRIRVEVPNPSKRPAGERVSVSFVDRKGASH